MKHGKHKMDGKIMSDAQMKKMTDKKKSKSKRRK